VLCFRAKDTIENKALEEVGDTQLFMLDQEGLSLFSSSRWALYQLPKAIQLGNKVNVYGGVLLDNPLE